MFPHLVNLTEFPVPDWKHGGALLLLLLPDSQPLLVKIGAPEDNCIRLIVTICSIPAPRVFISPTLLIYLVTTGWRLLPPAFAFHTKRTKNH
jgi:hypothetical protein